MVCLVIMVVGITTIAGMPVDLFPKIDIPVVVVLRSHRACRHSRSKRILPTHSNASSTPGQVTSTTLSHYLLTGEPYLRSTLSRVPIPTLL